MKAVAKSLNENWMCADFAGLAEGPPVPHEYLVRLGSEPLTYMCLICDTHFKRKEDGETTHWVMLFDMDGNPRRFTRLFDTPYVRQSLR